MINYKNKYIDIDGMNRNNNRYTRSLQKQQQGAIQGIHSLQSKGLFTFYIEQQQVQEYNKYIQKERQRELLRERQKQKQKQRNKQRQRHKLMELQRIKQRLTNKEREQIRVTELKVYKIKNKQKQKNQLREVLKQLKSRKQKKIKSKQLAHQLIQKSGREQNEQKQQNYKSRKSKKSKSKSKNKESITALSKSFQNVQKKKKKKSHKSMKTQNENNHQTNNQQKQKQSNFCNSTQEIKQQINQIDDLNLKDHKDIPILQQIQCKSKQGIGLIIEEKPYEKFLKKIKERKSLKSPTMLSGISLIQEHQVTQIVNLKQTASKFNKLLYPKESMQEIQHVNKFVKSKSRDKQEINGKYQQVNKGQNSTTNKNSVHEKDKGKDKNRKVTLTDQIFQKKTYQKKIRSLSTRKRLYTQLPKQKEYGQTYDMSVKQDFYSPLNKIVLCDSAPTTAKFINNQIKDEGYNDQKYEYEQYQSIRYQNQDMDQLNNPISPPSFAKRQEKEKDMKYQYLNGHQYQQDYEKQRQSLNLNNSQNNYQKNTRKLVCESLKLPYMKNVRLSKQLEKVTQVASQQKINANRYDSIKSKASSKKLSKKSQIFTSKDYKDDNKQLIQKKIKQSQKISKKRLLTQFQNKFDQNKSEKQTKTQNSIGLSAIQQKVPEKHHLALIDLSRHDIHSNDKSDQVWRQKKKMLFKKLGLKI